MWETAFFILGLVLILLGMVGVILPGLPGAPLIFVGALTQWLLIPGLIESWMILILLTLAVIDVVVDWGSSLLAVKISGAGTAALIGAMIGLLIGLIYGPVGLILGPMVGAAIGEYVFVRRELKAALKTGLAVGVGVVAAMVVQIIIALAMISLIVADWFVIAPSP